MGYNDNLPDSEEETFVIVGFLDEPIEVKAEVKLCPVTDIMGKQMHNIAIQLYARPNWEGGPEWEPFAMITKPFGEYLSIKNASYMDTNNYPFVTQLLKLGLAQDTGLTKAYYRISDNPDEFDLTEEEMQDVIKTMDDICEALCKRMGRQHYTV